LPFFHSRLALYALMAILSVVVLIGHQALPPMDRDESRFAQASKQMQQTGDYVTVRFQDELRAKKPAGIYWLQSSFAHILGPDAIASYRFVNLLALLAAVFALYHIGLQLYDPRSALAAAALFSSGFLVLGEVHLAKTDTVLMALALAQQWALMQLYLAWQNDQPPPRHGWLWFWLAMAAGILVKGPVLPVLALLSVAALCLWHRQFRWLAIIRFWRGFAIILVLCLPWALLVSAATDGAFLSTAISGDLLAKVKSGQESHGAAPGTYALVLALLIWPATPLLIWAAGQVKAFTSRAETRFLLAWIVPFWVMIELIPTKLPHYPLPVLPALILLLIGGVAVLAKPADGTAKWRYYLGISLRYLGIAVGLVMALVVIWGAMTFGGETSRQALGFAFLGLGVAALAAWFGHLWIRQALWRPFFGMIGAAMLFHMIVFSGVFPALSRIHVSSAIAAKIAALPAAPAAIATSGYQEPSLVFLLGRDLLLLDPTEAALFLIEAPGGLAIIEQRHQAAFLDAASQLKLGLAPPVQLSGFNISKGQEVVILLYRTEIFDATVSKE